MVVYTREAVLMLKGRKSKYPFKSVQKSKFPFSKEPTVKQEEKEAKKFFIGDDDEDEVERAVKKQRKKYIWNETLGDEIKKMSYKYPKSIKTAEEKIAYHEGRKSGISEALKQLKHNLIDKKIKKQRKKYI